MHRLVSAVLLVVLAPTAKGECLSVVQQQFQRERAESGMEQVRWMAELVNRCAQAFDADLRARLLDAKGNLVYEQRDLVRVPPAAQQAAGRSTHVPSDDLPRIKSIRVVIVEERPRLY